VTFEYGLDPNMSFACYGAGEAAKKFAQFLLEHDLATWKQIKFFIDDSPNKEEISSKKILSFSQGIECCIADSMSVLICVKNEKSIDGMKNKLARMGVSLSKIFIIKCHESLIADYIYKNDIIDSNIIAFDIGARDNNRLASLEFGIGKENLTVFAFDPDSEECERLSAHAINSQKDYRFFPIALWEKEIDDLPIHIFSSDGRGGCYPVNTKLSDRLVANVDKNETRLVYVKATTLDNFCEQNAIKGIDFLKLNVDSAEFEILDGAKHILQNTKFLRVEVNTAEFFSGAKLFHLVAELLLDAGLTVLDCDKFYRLERKYSPFHFGFSNQKGALIQFDLLAAKDPVADDFVGWQFDDVLKFIILLEANAYLDFAFEVMCAYLKFLHKENSPNATIVKHLFEYSFSKYGEMYDVESSKVQYLS